MALIVCPDCGKEYSSRAMMCPNCGCPNDTLGEVQTQKAEDSTLLADKAFDDAKFQSAYDFFNDLYGKCQVDTHILIRLAVSTCAVDSRASALPNSSTDLINKALAMSAKKGSDAYNGVIIQLVDDTMSMIGSLLSEESAKALALLDTVTTTRSGGAMIADALLAPMSSANRNLYEDNRILRANNRIISNAQRTVELSEERVKLIKHAVFEMIVSNVPENFVFSDEAIMHCDSVVTNKEDYEQLVSLVKDKEKVGAFGRMYGKEVELIKLDNISVRYWGDDFKSSGYKWGLFEQVNGTMTISNYRFTYKGDRPKWTFSIDWTNLSEMKYSFLGVEIYLSSFRKHIAISFATTAAYLLGKFLSDALDCPLTCNN